MLRPSHTFRLHSLRALALLAAACGLPALGQEFEFGIAAPDSVEENSTFEVRFTLTSRAIPAGFKGAQGWALGVAHRDLSLISVTTSGTVVEDLGAVHLSRTEITSTAPGDPPNEGFVSGVVFSGQSEVTLPPSGAVVVARALYRAGSAACLREARIEVRDGLVGSGVPIENRVVWEGGSYPALPSSRSYPGCRLNDYRLRLAGPQDLLQVPLGETRRLDLAVILEQRVSSARAWTLAISHDPRRLRLLDASIRGTGVEALLGPAGFALFEITQGSGNSGFTAQVELSPEEPRALPGPVHPVAVARYETLPATEPSEVGSRAAIEVRFADSLQGSGQPLSNTVLPGGTLLAEPYVIEMEVLPPGRLLRGDSSGDGRVDIGDALAVLFFLFAGLEEPLGCLEGADSNNDGHLDITDAVLILERLFVAHLPFPHPWPDCGEDPGFHTLDCHRTACRS